MPLTAKGEKILASLEKEYGAEKAKEVLYAGKNKGTFTGIDSEEDDTDPARLRSLKLADALGAVADAAFRMDDMRKRVDAYCARGDAERKLHIRSSGNRHVVYEVVKGGERAVSKEFSTKAEAEAAMAKLKAS